MNESRQEIALVDCDNFFVSCERVFRPDLNHKPVVVLSSNDGCVISRSREVKDMGIKMGEPWFKLKSQHQQITAFSSNFPLYADISNRVKQVLATFSPIQESYSVDESFLDLTGFTDVWKRAFTIRETILQQLSIPTCVGIGPTKTLAKLANHIAKKHPRSRGVFSWNRLTDTQKQKLLKRIPIQEVWGIGRRLCKRLINQHILSAYDLQTANLSQMRAQYGVIMERLISELRETPCLELVEIRPPRKQMLSSRSFGQLVTDLNVLENAVAFHTSHVCENLRKEKSVAGLIQIFLQTDRFRTDLYQYSQQICMALDTPTDDTIKITKTAMAGLHQIFAEDVPYKKAGVCLMELMDADAAIPDLFSTTGTPAVITAMDKINQRFGDGTVRISRNDASTRGWRPRKDQISPAYTTQWKDFPVCG